MDTYAMPEILRTGANELEIVNFRIYEDRPEGLYQWILGRERGKGERGSQAS